MICWCRTVNSLLLYSCFVRLVIMYISEFLNFCVRGLSILIFLKNPTFDFVESLLFSTFYFIHLCSNVYYFLPSVTFGFSFLFFFFGSSLRYQIRLLL